jgi:hypothetical protein
MLGRAARPLFDRLGNMMVRLAVVGVKGCGGAGDAAFDVHKRDCR